MENSSTTQPQVQTTLLDVMYYPGITVYGSLPARLELKNDRLTLTTVEGTKEAPIYKEVFNASISEITKVRSMLDELRVVVNGKAHRMSVAQYAGPVVAAGGVVGGAVAYGMYKKSGAASFVELLRQKGIQVSRFGYGALYGVAIGFAVLIMAIIVGAFFFTQ